MPPKVLDPCQSKACAIQACLAANNYQESRCEKAILAMRDCCLQSKDDSQICEGFMKKFTNQVYHSSTFVL